MKILNFGSCNIDYVYRVPHMVRPGETLSAGSMEIFAGGKGLNQTIAAARAGAKVWHGGCIGSDGGMLLEVLQKSGAHTGFLRRLDCKNGHAIIQLDDRGENSIVIHPGTNGMMTESYIDEVLACFAPGDLLMLQNEINLLPYLIKRAHARGLQIMLNPSPFTPALKELDLHKLTWLILNETEAMAFSGTADPMDALDALARMAPDLKVVLTLGGDGCICMAGGERIRQQAFRVRVVDTTGAGDTFTGYFAALLARGKTRRESLKIASAAAALAVSAMGAAPSIPTMKQVMEALPGIESGN